MPNDGNGPVENPTYMGHIRYFFTEEDKQHMWDWVGIDLRTYYGVKTNAWRTYFRVEEGSMPPPPDREPWSEDKVRTFYNWMRNGFPRGYGEPRAAAALTLGAAGRVRRNLADLGEAELEKLGKAFTGIMDRPIDDPQSYFLLAGLHWLPGPSLWCRHHENAYNPWHRVYLLRFEDALRSVDGCEDVTLPYWDIESGEIPEVVWEEPFRSYVLPEELCALTGTCYPAGYETERNPAEDILEKLDGYGVADNISEALGHSHWERFNGWDDGQRTQDGIIAAHDNGHNSCGPTMTEQDVAAFDPIFWFFHSNWDRLWWKWQQLYDATTLSAFHTHLLGKPDWLDDPVLNKLAPFDRISPETIDLSALGVDYEHPADPAPVEASAVLLGSRAARTPFKLRVARKVSIRVKEVDRLQIPGSFDVVLHVGDKVVARQAFFQANAPKECSTCRKKALVNFDFVIDQAELDGPVRVTIRLNSGEARGHLFPLEMCGDPTVNVRLLMEE